MNGNVLKKLRIENHLTQQQLGDAVGVSGSTIRMIEIKQRSGSIDLCSKLSDYFGVSMDYLEGKTPYKNEVDVATHLVDKLKGLHIISNGADIDDNLFAIINYFVNKKTSTPN